MPKHARPTQRCLKNHRSGPLTSEQGDVARTRLSADPIVYGGLIFTLDSKMVLSATGRMARSLGQKI